MGSGAETGRDSLFTLSHPQTEGFFIFLSSVLGRQEVVDMCHVVLNAERKVDVFPKGVWAKVWG